MDTPRTNLGNATYLGRPPPDFDMTQEPSFQSPSKDNNLVQQLRNRQGASLRTPRGNRAPLGDRYNLPAGITGSEFTPMLRSATRNSARRRGKENTNGLATPALGKIDEDMDMTNVPVESSLFGPSRNLSYADTTALPEVEASSAASTPMVLPTRRGDNKGMLQDGNQLSLREQENVIDKIEKENFGLKLKIHFLEEALRKTGPGFSEATVKENTELKVDKVTMQRELSKYKKHLASAEKDLETYQQQIFEVKERAKQKYADQGQTATQKAENDALYRRLDDRKAEIEDLKRQLEKSQGDDDEMATMQRELSQYKEDLAAAETDLASAERELEDYRQQVSEFQQENDNQKFAEQSHKAETDALHARLADQDAKIDALKRQLKDPKKDHEKVMMERELSQYKEDLASAEKDLEDYQITIQKELSRYKEDLTSAEKEIEAYRGQISAMQQESNEHKSADQGHRAETNTLRSRLVNQDAEIDNLRRQLHRAQNDDKAAMQRELSKYEKQLATAENSVEIYQQQIRDAQKKAQQDSTDQRTEIDALRRRLRDQDAEMQKSMNQNAEIETLRRRLKDRDTKIEDLQQLQQLQDNDRETKLRDTLIRESEKYKSQEAAHSRQMDALRRDLEARQSALTTLHGEIATLRDDLRQSEADCQARTEKIEALEDEVEVLQATLDEESEDASQRLKQADELCRDLERQLDLVRRENAQATGRLGRLEDANGVADKLKQQLDESNENIRDAERKCRDLEHQLEMSKRENAQQAKRLRQLEDADGAAEKLRQQLKETKQDLQQVEQERDDLHRQLERSKRENAHQTGRLGELEDADSVAAKLRRQLEDADKDADQLRRKLEETKKDLHKAEQECEDLQRQLERSKRDNALQTGRLGELEDADSVATKLRRQLEDADREAEKLRQKLEEAKQNLQDAVEECDELDHQLELSNRENARQTDRLSQLENAEQELEETKMDLHDAEQECEDLKHQLEAIKRDNAEKAGRLGQLETTADNAATRLRQELDDAAHERDDLERQLSRAQKDAERAKLVSEDLRSQLDAVRRDLDYANPLCKELRQKLDRARTERATYQAAVAKLEVDCERLKKGAQDALAWIQAKNAEQDQQLQLQQQLQQQQQPAQNLMDPRNGGVIKKAAATAFRYGDIIRDVVDQEDHEAVIRAASAAQRRHELEVQGLALHIECMQARFEREVKMRRDAAHAKKWLLLQLGIAEACNKADLRKLARIHQDLGIKSPKELLQAEKDNNSLTHNNSNKNGKKPLNNLKVFLHAVRAVARMRVGAKKWAAHEKTRLRVVAAWEEQRRSQKLLGQAVC